MAYQMSVLIALADPTRQAILQRLRDHPLPVGEIAAAMPISRPAVSQHLRILKEVQLVREERRGTRHYFKLNPEGFGELRAYIDSMWQDALQTFAQHVEKQKGRRKTRK
jgi:DNA-binding transcriptional ArsR family regulator